VHCIPDNYGKNADTHTEYVTNIAFAFSLLKCLGEHDSLLRLYVPWVLISPYSDLLPDVFCLIVRIFLLMLVLFYIYIYIYIYIYSTNIPPIMIINRIYENQNLLSL